MPEKERYIPIADYGIIGDLRTCALVGKNSSIDFLCFPRFDSPSVFAANADADKGGRFLIEPLLEEGTRKELYIPDTNILLNRFLSDDGIAEISSYMVVDDDIATCEQALVRRAKCVHGRVKFRLLFQPRFDYARAKHRARKEGEGTWLFESEGADGLTLRLHSSVPLELTADGDAVAEFELGPDEHATFVMEDAAQPASPCSADGYASESFKRTADYWRCWVSRSRYSGRWREMVSRSALALKLLASHEFGSIIAAPCFGFPNEIGGERNWDYRYTWIRDASFTTYALMRLGYTEEVAAYVHWLEARLEELDDGDALEIMYNIDGSHVDGEFHLDHLEGYMGSKPVRIGSSNHDQMQIDIYGELMDSLYLFDSYGEGISYDLWKKVVRLVEYVIRHWQEPDVGIWEVRSGRKEFLFSRVMCWVAIDRGIRLATKRSLPCPLEEWRAVRDAIHKDVMENFWNEKRQAFCQFKGSDAMDASALIMPLVRFIGASDPRWLSTLKAIEKDLVHDSLVYRYRVGEAFCDELEGGEGTFSICSFWYIECISRSGDLKKARFLFEKMLSYGNNLGLFSEQLGRRAEFLGNVPQAFTHLALISAAFDLNRRLDKSHHPSAAGGFG